MHIQHCLVALLHIQRFLEALQRQYTHDVFDYGRQIRPLDYLHRELTAGMQYGRMTGCKYLKNLRHYGCTAKLIPPLRT